MQREAAPKYTVVVIGCPKELRGSVMLKRCLTISEGDLTIANTAVNSHIWEFSEIWEAFAKGGDREGGEGP